MPPFGTKTKDESVRGDTLAVADVSSVSSLRQTRGASNAATFVRNLFNRAFEHKISMGVEDRLLSALRAARGEHDAQTQQALRAAGVSIKLASHITRVKCNSALAMLKEVFVDGADDEWGLKPTPIPELPFDQGQAIFAEMMRNVMLSVVLLGHEPTKEELDREIASRYDDRMQSIRDEAEARVKRCERLMRDQLLEGGFRTAKARYVNDICTYGTAFIEGPVMRTVSRPKMKKNRLGGKVYDFENVTIPTFKAISPWDVFPSPDCSEIGDSPICIRVSYPGHELDGFVAGGGGSGSDADGWKKDAIEELMTVHGKGYRELDHSGNESERKRLENRGAALSTDSTAWQYDGIQCYAILRGSVIEGEGFKTLSRKKIDPKRFYLVELVTIADYVVYFRIGDELRIPLSRGKFYDDPGSFWGSSIADACVVAQNLQDSAIYYIKINMGISSAPMFWVDDFESLLQKGEKSLEIRPTKIFARNAGLGSRAGPPIGVIDVPNHLNELVGLIDHAAKVADNDTGIPAYTYGNQSAAAGVARTATGLKMLTEAAMRGMKLVIGQTDKDVIENILMMLYEWNMINGDDPEIMGDAQVEARGVMGKILREGEKEGRMQFLTMSVSNPILVQTVGNQAIGRVMRMVAEDLGLESLMPSDKQLADAEMLEKIRQMVEINNSIANGEATRMGAETAQAQSQMQMQQQQQQQQLPQGGGGGQQIPGVGAMPPVLPDATGATGHVAQRQAVA